MTRSEFRCSFSKPPDASTSASIGSTTIFDIEKTPLQSIGLVAGLSWLSILAFLRFPVVLKFQPACADRSAVAGERPCTAVKQLEDLAASISRVVR